MWSCEKPYTKEQSSGQLHEGLSVQSFPKQSNLLKLYSCKKVVQSLIKLYITQIVFDIGHRRGNEDSFRESFLFRSIERKKIAVSYFFVVIVSKSIKNRKVLLKYTFCRVTMLTAVFAFCVLVGAVRALERPNIILIIADDLVRHPWLFESIPYIRGVI